MSKNVHTLNAAAAAKSLQSCPTLCDSRDGSPPGSPVPGILQARTLEWVAIAFSNAWKWKVKVKSLSCVRLLANPWTAAYQAPPSMGFSRQEYWSAWKRTKTPKSHLSLQWVIISSSWRVWNIVRITKMWHRGTEWANAAGKKKVVPKELLNTVATNFQFIKKQKQGICKSTIKV